LISIRDIIDDINYCEELNVKQGEREREREREIIEVNIKNAFYPR
jgi:hypothetical protein